MFWRERSSNPVMQQNSSFRECVDTSLGPEKNSSGTNDVISMFVHVLSFDCYAILRTFECRGSLYIYKYNLYLPSAEAIAQVLVEPRKQLKQISFAMSRQISESVQINQVQQDQLINTKSEWSFFRIPRAIVTQS